MSTLRGGPPGATAAIAVDADAGTPCRAPDRSSVPAAATAPSTHHRVEDPERRAGPERDVAVARGRAGRWPAGLLVGRFVWWGRRRTIWPVAVRSSSSWSIRNVRSETVVTTPITAPATASSSSTVATSRVRSDRFLMGRA